MKPPPLHAYIEELRLAGFRAFEKARLRLGELTVLVGRNGSGKSTLIDALEFVRDALTDSLENALDRRGGLQALMHQGSRRSTLSIALKLRLPSWHLALKGPLDVALPLPSVRDAPLRFVAATYGFRLGPKRGGAGFVVKDERALIGGKVLFSAGTEASSFFTIWPSALGLPLQAGSDPALRYLLKCLQGGVRAHNPAVAAIRSEPPVGRAGILSRNGDNTGDVLHDLQRRRKDLDWLTRHLSAIVPGLTSVKASTAAGRRLIQFVQSRGGAKSRFNIGDMSDGTLRCLAILLALRQHPTPLLTCIEEIEDSVHPAVLDVLLDAISSSTERGQVLITSHSPEVLSHPAIAPENVRIIEWHNGRSQIFQPSPGAREASKPPRSVGALLRTNALFPARTPDSFEGDIFDAP